MNRQRQLVSFGAGVMVGASGAQTQRAETTGMLDRSLDQAWAISPDLLYTRPCVAANAPPGLPGGWERAWLIGGTLTIDSGPGWAPKSARRFRFPGSLRRHRPLPCKIGSYKSS